MRNFLNVKEVTRKFLNHNGLCASHSSFNNKNVKELTRCRGLLGGILHAKNELQPALPLWGTGGDTDTPSAPDPNPTAKWGAVKITKVQVG